MSPRLAVELTPTHVRALVASSWRDAALRTVEVAWSPDDPGGGIAALRGAVGPVESVAVAVGLGLLQVAGVALPPTTDEVRERIVALETERWFPLAGAPSGPPVLVSCMAPGGAVAFAAAAPALERWCAALESLAPVVRVEAAPVALARALRRVPGGPSQATYAIPLDHDDRGMVTVRDGRVTAARRIPAHLDDAPGLPLPIAHGVPPTHLAAWGALLGEDEGVVGTLATPARRARFVARRRRRLAVAVVAATAGIALALVSADRWRERTLQALQDDVASRRAAAAPGELALAARAQLEAEFALLARAGGARDGTLGALAAISSALPRDAVVLNAHAVGGEWELDGTASNAAALVPLLDRDGRFEQVRLRSASSRFRDGGRTRETFALSLRVRPRS